MRDEKFLVQALPGCQMNKRKKHTNSAQLLQWGSTNWALSP